MKTMPPQEDRDAERARLEHSVTSAAQAFQQNVRTFGDTVRRRRLRREAAESAEAAEGSSVPPSPR